MVVSYNDDWDQVDGLKSVTGLLIKWKGSFYKLIWKDLVFFLGLYSCLAAYSYGTDAYIHNESFKTAVKFCRRSQDRIPLNFLLGFYVTLAINRWWNQLMAFPWPEASCLFIASYIRGTDTRGRMIRRTLARWLNLSFVMVLGMLSQKVHVRFPTLQQMVNAGFMHQYEKAILDAANEVNSQVKWWVPMSWCYKLIQTAEKENRIPSKIQRVRLEECVNHYQKSLLKLLNYDKVPIPLIYDQITSLACYIYMVASLMSNQYIDGDMRKDTLELLPLLGVLEVLIYFGLLRVGDNLLGIYGSDDEDELNWIIDRNLKVSFLMVDQALQTQIEIVEDRADADEDDEEGEMPYWFGVRVPRDKDKEDLDTYEQYRIMRPKQDKRTKK